jgi:hypothetical protein
MASLDLAWGKVGVTPQFHLRHNAFTQENEANSGRMLPRR